MNTINQKIVIMGNPAVGKTTLAKKYLGEGFVDDYIPTLGANFSSKIYEIDNQRFRVMIIDMGGQHNFKELRERYFVGSSGVLLVFDVTRPFDAENQLKPWVKEVMLYTNNKGLPLAVLGNKIDLNLLRQIETYKGINAASEVKSLMDPENPVQYFETSAKHGTGVTDAFDWLIEMILSRSTDEN